MVTRASKIRPLVCFNNILYFTTFVYQIRCEFEDSCNLHLSMSRELQNEGLHREIYYSFEILTNGMWDDCKLLVEECFPSGLYVSNDQLDDLERLGKISAVTNVTVNTEAPEDTSFPITVWLYINLTRSFNIFTSSSTLPFHVRYHKAQQGGRFQQAVISPPKIYITCSIFTTDCRPSNATIKHPCFPRVEDLCDFHQLLFYSNDDLSLTVNVPVGDTDHHPIVLSLTFFVTILGSCYISFIIFTNHKSEK